MRRTILIPLAAAAIAALTIGIVAATAGTGSRSTTMSHTGHSMGSHNALTTADLRVTLDRLLGEHAILNNVQTLMLRDPKQRQHVFENLHNLVVKEVQGSGGYGMLIGPASTAEEREAYKARVMKNPDNYIAQPTLALSTAPTLIDGEIVPRHVDLRPFVLSGRETSVIPGGLTRVALRKGSLVVNSSQGGGTKDTWVLER